MSLGLCQRHIEDKARLVLDGYLRSELATRSIAGVSERLNNLVVNIGLDPTTLITGSTVDALPQVDFYVISSVPDYDAALTTRDVIWSYQVGSIAQFDGSDPAAAARSASYLCGATCDVLEEYLSDPTTQALPCIWMVETTAPTATEVTPLDPGDSRVHTMRATAEITISTRVDYSNKPTYSVQTLTPGDPTLIDLADGTIKLDAATLTTATPLRHTTVTTTTAALAGGTSIVLDLDGVCTWDAGAAYTVSMVRHGAAATGTLDGSNAASIALATYNVVDGDRWLVTVIGPKNRPITWALTWSVS